MRKQQQVVVEQFADANKRDMSLVTIVFDLAASAAEIEGVWKKGKSDFHNLWNAMKRERRRWDDVQVVGWLEAVPVISDDLHRLGSQQRDLLVGLGFDQQRHTASPAWLVHIHAIVHHPGLAFQEIRDALADQWSTDRAVDVQPFYADKDRDESVRDIVKYALKYPTGREVAGVYDEWRPEWMAEFFEAVDAFSDGHKSLKLSKGLKAQKEVERVLPAVVADGIDEDVDVGVEDAMPVVFGFSDLLHAPCEHQFNSNLLLYTAWRPDG